MVGTMVTVPGSRIVIVDTAGLYFRAYYGVPATLVNAAGQPVNAVHGLLDMLARLIEQYSPTDLVCAWDDDWRPAWRVDLVPSYKAHRVAEPGEADLNGEEAPDDLSRQVPWIAECLSTAGLCVAGAPGYEADDVAGVVARRAAANGGQAIVVTGDRDLFQLVADGIKVAYVGRGLARQELVDDAWLVAKYGILGEQYVDFATMRGDPSDGLPGVAGIGEKTAAGLLASHGTLDEIISAAEDPASAMPARLRASISQAADYLARARTVVAVADAPLDELDAALRPGRADLARCAELAERHNCRGPMNRLLTALGEVL